MLAVHAQVARGPVAITFGPLGEECRGGCRAYVIMSTARPAGGASAASIPDVPTSALFDPLSPFTASAEIGLTVLDAKPLGVAVTVTAPAKSSDGTPVVLPKDSAPVTARVTATAGSALANAEVTFIAVDAAVLDVLPYPLQVGGVAGLPPQNAKRGG